MFYSFDSLSGKAEIINPKFPLNIGVYNEEVDYVIYLTPDSYIRFPSDFLRKIKDRMYRPHDGRYMGVFDIDCDDLSIILKNGREDIDNYYYHLP